MESTNIFNYVTSVKDNSIDYYNNLILGQQAYSTALYCCLFSNVTQDYKSCRDLRKILKEPLLPKYLQENFPNPFRHDKNQDVLYKMRKSYLLIGVKYCMQGYDTVHSDLRRTADKYLDKFIDATIAIGDSKTAH